MAQRRVPLFDTSEDQTLRIQKELAVKIGFNEAIILMQIEYLISITDNERDGNWWTWQTLEELKENSFPWWSIATISRALKSLKEQGIIFIDSFNKRKGDKTQWFALNIEKVKELGIKLNEKHPIFQNEKWVGGDTIMKEEEASKEEKGPVTEPESAPEQLPIFQIDGTIFQNAIPIFQIETTLPETPTKIPIENISPKGDSGLPPPLNELIPESEPVPEENLLPDTPETLHLFEKINHNRKLKNRGPMKQFKSTEQKQKCVAAMGRLPPRELEKSITKGLEKGLTDIASLINWIARWELPRNGAYKNGHKPKTEQSNLNPANPDDWQKMLDSV